MPWSVIKASSRFIIQCSWWRLTYLLNLSVKCYVARSQMRFKWCLQKPKSKFFTVAGVKCAGVQVAHTYTHAPITQWLLLTPWVVGNCSCSRQAGEQARSQHHLRPQAPGVPQGHRLRPVPLPAGSNSHRVLTPHPTRYGQGSTFFSLSDFYWYIIVGINAIPQLNISLLFRMVNRLFKFVQERKEGKFYT